MAKKFALQQFLNRELGQLEFNRHVLAQAEDAAIPLLERLKYLCIVSSNLDEFFEIRVAGLKEQIKLVCEQVHQLIERQYRLFDTDIIPALAGQGIRFLRRIQWDETQQAWVKDFLFREVMPVIDHNRA